MRYGDCPKLNAPRKDTRPLVTCPKCAWSMRTSDPDASLERHLEGVHAPKAEKSVEEQLADALRVLVLCPETRVWLEVNDPMALAQAERAVAAYEEYDKKYLRVEFTVNLSDGG